MSDVRVQDHPVAVASKFSASLVETPGLPHNLTVTGEVVGDYRVQNVKLVRAHHQGSTTTTLVLDITSKLGPVENPHPDNERVWPLQYDEDPAHHRYNRVEIVNGVQRFMVNVVFVL